MVADSNPFNTLARSVNLGYCTLGHNVVYETYILNQEEKDLRYETPKLLAKIGANRLRSNFLENSTLIAGQST